MRPSSLPLYFSLSHTHTHTHLAVRARRFSGADEASVGAAASALSQPLVKRADLIKACGPVAQQLKSYQLVGINFLMMLHKSESVGE